MTLLTVTNPQSTFISSVFLKNEAGSWVLLWASTTAPSWFHQWLWPCGCRSQSLGWLAQSIQAKSVPQNINEFTKCSQLTLLGSTRGPLSHDPDQQRAKKSLIHKFICSIEILSSLLYSVGPHQTALLLGRSSLQLRVHTGRIKELKQEASLGFTFIDQRLFWVLNWIFLIAPWILKRSFFC